MNIEYIHAPLGQEVTVKAGNYIPCKEVRLKHNDKEILYIAGISTAGNAFCCSEEFCGYIIVPGYIMSWQKKATKAGLPVSMVEPVEDEAAKREIGNVVREREKVMYVDFW